MQTLRRFLAVPMILIVALLASPAPAAARQRHAVDPALLAGTIDERVARQDADRAAIRAALDRREVQQVAKELGVDLTRTNAAVGTLTGSDLERAATAARQVNDALTGGASTIVISTTTVIIILLVLVLIIVALK